ncbi:hypothetical protein NX722_23560 [Endozoicomonas gorgoniicola]|uniref:XRE family transcriptional regulator n=1 Tax=Endozoicomonas gorgoniicola TaxID=1234144 RepID=A0ABT3N1N3_9GAMM|nr:hypothetical protein [Endozoicomonas gorgoniicola]MCW7555545.1 hypothetical protein [Endozoicomonas gorgoniicola]
MAIFITKFQFYLRQKSIPYSDITRHLGCDRSSINRWKKGEQFPNKLTADRIIDLYGQYSIPMDYNSIYEPTIEIRDKQ